jgi:hypothetical protein
MNRNYVAALGYPVGLALNPCKSISIEASSEKAASDKAYAWAWNNGHSIDARTWLQVSIVGRAVSREHVGPCRLNARVSRARRRPINRAQPGRRQTPRAFQLRRRQSSNAGPSGWFCRSREAHRPLKSWQKLRPVTAEAAGSSPVARAIILMGWGTRSRRREDLSGRYQLLEFRPDPIQHLGVVAARRLPE